MIVRSVRVNCACYCGCISWRINGVLCIPNSLLSFEICFAIKVHCLDVGYSRSVRRLDENQVGRETLVLVDFDELSNLKICPSVVYEAVRLGVDSLNVLVVFDFVFCSPF